MKHSENITNLLNNTNTLMVIGVLISLTLGQFAKIVPGVYVHDVILCLYLLLNVKKVPLLMKDRIRRLGWLFIGVAVITFSINSIGKTESSIMLSLGYLLRWSLYYVFYCFITFDTSIKGHKYIDLGLKAYVLAVLTIGLSQLIIFPDMRILSVLGWDDHYYRLIGSWLDPNFTGIILVLGLLGVMGMFDGHSKSGKIILCCLVITGILLTYSRSTYLAMIIGLFFLFRWRIGLIFSLAAGLIIAGYAFLIPKPAGEGGNLLRRVSIDARIRSYNRGIEIFKTSPIYGVGFNYYKNSQEELGYIPSTTNVNVNSASGNDNSFIFILATTGVIGLGVFLLFWIKLFINGNQTIKASVAAITVHSFFNNSIFFPAVIIWLWILIGVSGNSSNSINRVIEKTKYDKS